MADSFSAAAAVDDTADGQPLSPRDFDPYGRDLIASFHLREAERGDSLKIRLSRVLNNGGQTGRRVGNTMGVVSLMFSAMELGINAATGDEGIRNMVVAGALGGIIAGLAAMGKPKEKEFGLIDEGWG